MKLSTHFCLVPNLGMCGTVPVPVLMFLCLSTRSRNFFYNILGVVMNVKNI